MDDHNPGPNGPCRAFCRGLSFNLCTTAPPNDENRIMTFIFVVVVAVAVAVPAVPDNQFHVMSKPVIVADPNKGVKVDAAVVAKPFREEIQKQVKELKEQGIGTYKTCLEIKDSY